MSALFSLCVRLDRPGNHVVERDYAALSPADVAAELSDYPADVVADLLVRADRQYVHASTRADLVSPTYALATPYRARLERTLILRRVWDARTVFGPLDTSSAYGSLMVRDLVIGDRIVVPVDMGTVAAAVMVVSLVDTADGETTIGFIRHGDRAGTVEHLFADPDECFAIAAPVGDPLTVWRDLPADLLNPGDLVRAAGRWATVTDLEQRDSGLIVAKLGTTGLLSTWPDSKLQVLTRGYGDTPES